MWLRHGNHISRFERIPLSHYDANKAKGSQWRFKLLSMWRVNLQIQSPSWWGSTNLSPVNWEYYVWSHGRICQLNESFDSINHSLAFVIDVDPTLVTSCFFDSKTRPTGHHDLFMLGSFNLTPWKVHRETGDLCGISMDFHLSLKEG